MAALPYMQLYVAEYLADTAHLTAAQHGAYLLLIFNYWQRGKPLNNSNERLTNVARMTNEEWAEAKPVLSEFFEIDGDTWKHSRIERDLLAVNSKSGKASEAGKASAARRAAIKATSVQRTLNHTDTDTDTDIKPSCASSGDECADDEKSNSLYTKQFLAFWELYPRKKSKGDAAKAFSKVPKSEYPAVRAGIESAMKSPEWIKNGGEFIPYPASWLRARGWEDEIGQDQGRPFDVNQWMRERNAA